MPTSGIVAVRIGPNDVLRFALELFALFSLGFWGYLAWPFPWPGVLFMVGAPLFAAVVWALFRSPKAVFPLDVVGRSLVEIFVMGAAVAVWFMIGYPVVGVVFGVLAATSGVIAGRTEIAAELTAQEAEPR
ncbi:YrdB family protein [Lacisediminihabitans sp. H27-G8]|uniref:YrdB family protein n=1 Tax=Lacisediminihabitans sp. H27-G8 TaxID=3111909 RepID=UPI0038FCA0BA